MDAPASSFDLGELVTVAARPVLAQAIAKRYMVYFDHLGAPSEVFGNVEAHLRCFHRAMYAGMDLLKRGTLVMLAKTDPAIDALGVRFTLSLVVSGELVSRDAIAGILARLDCAPGASPDENSSVCPFTGATLRVARESASAALVQVTLDLPGRLRDAPAPYVDGEPVFLVHAIAQAAEGPAGRFRRFGWDVSIFKQCSDVLNVVHTGLVHPPSLIVVFESDQISEMDALRLQQACPGHPKVLFAVPAGSAAIGGHLGDEAVRIIPMLPSEMWDLSHQFAPADPHASRPMSLKPPEAPMVLVVDDNEVNLLVAEGLLRILGYRTVTATSGEQALERCARDKPALVLMDIEMPGWDGYQTTQRIKAAQRVGSLTPFPVVAVTASGSAAEAAQQGMDAYLPKPLHVGKLKTAVERALKGVALG